LENVDETAKKDIYFHKLMLLNANDYVKKLTKNSLSEIRSYKRPPKNVVFILKAVLYSLGRQPKEMKSWPDLLKVSKKILMVVCQHGNA
jgi:hypothetical protein